MFALDLLEDSNCLARHGDLDYTGLQALRNTSAPAAKIKCIVG